MPIVLGDTSVSGVASLVNNSTAGINISSSGNVTNPTLKYWHGSPTRTSGSGKANAAYTYSNRGITWNSDRITVSDAGLYLITFVSIKESTSGRFDYSVLINDVGRFNALTPNNGDGFAQAAMYGIYTLAANDYIQFSISGNWYNAAVTGTYEHWRVASVVFLG
jgi:hypothetical protein